MWVSVSAESTNPLGANDADNQLLGFDKTELESIAFDKNLKLPSTTNPSSILGFKQSEIDLLFSSKKTKPENVRQERANRSNPSTLDASAIANLNTIKKEPSIIGMPTGNSKSIYYPLGRDIAALAETTGLKIDVKTSSGSLDNIRRMASNENAGLAIVQSDIIEFLVNNPSKTNQSIIDNLRSVFSLYNEEIHLLAHKEIKTLQDLNNKRVIVGELGSGTPITANIVFDKIGVDIEAITGITPDKALKQFLMGEVDAIFFVGGKPISYINRLLEMKNDENLRKYTADIHLIPLDDERLYDTYTKANIYPTDYQSKNGLHRLTESTVPTIAAQALLVSYDFSKNDTPYYKRRCEQVRQLNSVIRKKLDELANNESGKYHSKWAEVDLDQATRLPQSLCISVAAPTANDLKAIDCYLETGSHCQ